tara:strand:+ start:982 stop:2085 length:1104 start_codon:yes stop_codon:yes gene_type:complete
MIQQFFIICSGADRDVLDNCSRGEKNKYAGIGATVFFTAVLASIAATYALFTVFDNIYRAILFGLLWGFVIFNLDRFIVSTLKKQDNWWKEFGMAVPRLILAVIIAIVISKPLELKIFEKEIDRVMLSQKNDFTVQNQGEILAQFTPEMNNLDAQIDETKAEIAAKETEVDNLYQIYIAEAEGTAGTELLGKGPVYQEKRDKHDAALAELTAMKTAGAEKVVAAETQKTVLTDQFNTAVSTSQPIINNFDGLMARIDAMKELPWLPSFFIFLLFLAIETAPIFSKLISPRGEYDIKLADADATIKQWSAQKAMQRKILTETDHILNDRVYTDLSQDEELYNYKKKMAREILKRQQDAFYRRQTKILG